MSYIIPAPGGGGADLTGNTLHVDAVNGTDTRTGLDDHSFSDPWLTLVAARNAAASGDLIVVRPGTYDEAWTTTDQLWKNGIRWRFEAGAIVNSSSGGWLFRPQTDNESCYVYGDGEFNGNLYYTDDGGGKPGSYLFIEGESYTGTQMGQGAGQMDCYIREIEGTGTGTSNEIYYFRNVPVADTPTHRGVNFYGCHIFGDGVLLNAGVYPPPAYGSYQTMRFVNCVLENTGDTLSLLTCVYQRVASRTVAKGCIIRPKSGGTYIWACNATGGATFGWAIANIYDTSLIGDGVTASIYKTDAAMSPNTPTTHAVSATVILAGGVDVDVDHDE